MFLQTFHEISTNILKYFGLINFYDYCLVAFKKKIQTSNLFAFIEHI